MRISNFPLAGQPTVRRTNSAHSSMTDWVGYLDLRNLSSRFCFVFLVLTATGKCKAISLIRNVFDNAIAMTTKMVFFNAGVVENLIDSVYQPFGIDSLFCSSFPLHKFLLFRF